VYFQVQPASQPSNPTVVIDTGAPVTVNSFTFETAMQGGSVATVDIVNSFNETLMVTGNITNNASTGPNPPVVMSFNLPVLLGANSVWTGQIVFSNFLNVGTYAVSMGNAANNPNSVNLTSGYLTFELAGSSVGSYGEITNTGGNSTFTFSSTTLSFVFTGGFTPNAGDSFSVLNSFTGLTAGDFTFDLPDVSGSGLEWDTSGFSSNGTITVNAIPEPTVTALLLSSVAGWLVLRFRRRLPSAAARDNLSTTTSLS
jgi:hypothetical protein